ncbi:MAG TPA: FG-GAP-like repeat-containing protein [Pirellulales bacterium]|nr:FG-GAP-like repeat-containing protein [Pirellulales bacterium]
MNLLTSPISKRWVALALSCACLLGCGRDEPPKQSTGNAHSQGEQNDSRPVLTAEMVAANNRGVALMGQFDYQAAYEIFRKLADEQPNWQDGQINLAIAQLNLNRPQSDDLDQSLKLLRGVLARDPSNLRANYCVGILLYNGSATAEARQHFELVAKADPSDGYAAYYTGRCLFDGEKFAESLEWYRRAIKADPYLQSAYYGCFQTLQRLGRGDEAKPMLADFEKLAKNPQARKADIKYTRMGPKAEAITVNLKPREPANPPAGPLFADAAPLKLTNTMDGEIAWTAADPKHPTPSVTICDIDGDGRPDIFIAGALVQGSKRLNAVLLQRDQGFLLDTKHPLAKVNDVNAVLWGDYDNDGLTDVYFCRRGGNQLWRQVAKGKWEDVTAKTHTAGNGATTVDGAMFDADHDGDLDLFLINSDGPNELLINNMDGTFRPIAKEHDIAGDGRPSRGLVVGPFTGNRVADLLVIHDQPPQEVYRNDRLWAYHKPDGFDELLKTDFSAAAMADPDAVGQLELITAGPDGLTRWRASDKGLWQPQRIAALPPRSGISQSSDSSADRGLNSGESSYGRFPRLAVADLIGGGTLSAIVNDPDGWRCVSLTGDDAVLCQAKEPALACWSLFAQDAKAGPAVVGFAWGKGPVIWKPGPGRYNFLALDFSGRHDKNTQMKSNASGIGVMAAVRVDSRWTAVDTYRNQSGPGQSLQPVAVGLGGAPAADFVSITWPDGVLETDIDLASGKLHHLVEQNRMPTSCPLLFVWNGRKFEFVTDCLGVGGLGYAIGPNQYAPVRPRENILIPPGLVQPLDGRLQLKLAEPMEEMTYLDSAALVTYDLPSGWRMTLDERAAVNGPEPTGEPRFYRDEMLPERAINDRGDDVTEAIRAADLKAAPPGRSDPRFIGRNEEHSVTLTFPRAIDSHAGAPLLVANGWIEYPYSQTMFAAWQAGADYRAPSIEARDANGDWHMVLHEFGYPAGMPREMSLPLGGLPKGCREIRLRTNEEIYWDRLAVAWSEACPEAHRLPLDLETAQLHYAGYPERTIGPQRQTTFDYDRRRPIADARYLTGFYTRYGDVKELVSETDDAVATIGPGEELYLEFAAPRSEPRPGWTRRFVLETHGWCKDTDLYTKDGDTVEPLPHRDNSSAESLRRSDELHKRYNTRFEAGR